MKDLVQDIDDCALLGLKIKKPTTPDGDWIVRATVRIGDRRHHLTKRGSTYAVAMGLLRAAVLATHARETQTGVDTGWIE